MIVNGNKIAQAIEDRLMTSVAASKKKLRLGIVLTTDNLATVAFVRKKKEFGERIGVDVRIYNETEHATSARALRNRVSEIVRISENNGIIIQLPLSSAVENVQKVLNAVPTEKDIDMLSARSVGDFSVGKSKTIPPVVGAIEAILENEEYKGAVSKKLRGSIVAVVGMGRLVGRPASIWFKEWKGATVIELDEHAADISHYTQKADIIISGVGKPRIITADMIKEGVVVIDAGVSQEGGDVVGDIDTEEVAKKAALVTPPKGGIGPITVAKVFENLLKLSRR